MRSQRRLVSPLSAVNLQPNTFIGGVASDIPDKSTLALRLGVSESSIPYFAVVGNDIEARVNVDYVLSSFSDFPGITSYIDKGKCTGLGIAPSGYFGAPTSIEIMEFPVATYHGGNSGRGSYNNDTNLKSLYIPNVVNIGASLGNDNLFWINVFYPNVKLYAHASMETINGGAEEGDLLHAKIRNVTVSYIQNFTPPNAITNLSIGTKYTTGLQINFTPPSSVNAIDFYEVYVNGVYKDRIPANGGYITGLNIDTSYTITVKAIDIYYNKSEFSNLVSDTTSATYVVPIAHISNYYRFNDNLVDEVNANNGTGTAITYAAGKSGNAASFNGSTSFISLPDNNDLSFTDGVNDKPFSIQMWVKFNSISGNQWLISKRNSSNVEWQIYRYLEKLSVSIYSGNSTSIQKTTNMSFTPTVGQWYHFTFTYSGTGNPKIYIDKILQSTENANAGTYTKMTNTTSPVTIGRFGPSSLFFLNGLIDCLPIFNKELNQAEIEDTYSVTNAGNELL